MVRRPPRDMRPEDVRAAVRASRYGTLAALARAFGLPAHAPGAALRGPHYGGELAIAEALGRSPREIWPSRYDEAGVRVHLPRRHWKPTSAAEPGHCENEAAA